MRLEEGDPVEGDGPVTAKVLSRFSIEIDQIRFNEVVYAIYPSYGNEMEVGVPFWASGRPRVIVMLSGDRFNPGPEWRNYRIQLLEFFLIDTEEDSLNDFVVGARREIARILAEKGK
jgi:hypothetical protein